MQSNESSMILVPICDLCGKPHFGRKNVQKRCICDVSGMYHLGLIAREIENEAKKPNESLIFVNK